VSAQLAAGAVLALCARPRWGALWRVWAACVPPVLLAMFLTSMYGLYWTTLGSFVVVRNAVPLTTLLFEACVHRMAPSRSEVAATVLIVAGAVLYESGSGASPSSVLGLGFLACNLVLSSGDRVLEKELLQRVDCNKQGLIFLNNAPGLVLFPVVLAFTRPPPAPDARGVAVVVGSCVMGTLINYAGMRLQCCVSASAMTVINCATKLVVVAYGVVCLGEARDASHVLAVALSFAGCLLFGCARAAAPPTEETAPLRSSGRV
jgi:drug/metabolite transporter (DMT)-like permease